MDTLELEARLGEYCQQLALLKQEDIREPNQSLILDFFCIDEVFADFLRKDVFCDTASRYPTWKFINLRESGPNRIVDIKELSNLLIYQNSQFKAVWAEIIKNTAKHQNHLGILLNISSLISNSEDVKGNSSKKENEFTGLVETDAPISMGPIDIKIASISDRIQVSSNKIGVAQNSQSQINPGLLTLMLISAFGFAAAMIGSAVNVPSTPTSDSPSSPSSPSSTSFDDISGLNQLETDSKQAVLICELRPLIDKANSLTLSDQSLVARKTQLVSSANTAIKFLDQTSGNGNKYWEDPSCTWGQQWFDNDANNEFRLFIAISKKCRNPAIKYKYAKDESGNVVTGRGTYNATGHQKGEIRLPYPQDGVSYTSIENVTCT
ncbi:hypothetical protein KBY83_12540 [Cyanobium sp. WKJ7-Wakatipu]|uniref:hypothetical protein n=1 Tax=Cyanobium sp. WKJ7-Wakatipu TaxID=2823726 RepID=UPI0020CC1CD3|nr:hypothetical protein [Cyanobium sp. WKJ7-Wakatipu]MCP9784129.1 hypothetical protein [Cyanobium sp. WKJ7-Wakatipu]